MRALSLRRAGVLGRQCPSSRGAGARLRPAATALGPPSCSPEWQPGKAAQPRPFHVTAPRKVVKPYLLADIGEGITECQVIQWFVQPGARVEQFDKICEVQSDKASVEITSRFDGVIKKLYYEADDMAKVGKPLVDIDIQSEISPEDERLTQVEGGQAPEKPREKPSGPKESKEKVATSPPRHDTKAESTSQETGRSSGKHATLATPAVRHLTKQLNVDIEDVQGTGKDGRVLKEDVQNYANSRSAAAPQSYPIPGPSATIEGTPKVPLQLPPQPLREDRLISFTPVQNQMFKTMTRSLSIPHFLYTNSADFTGLSALRRRLNARLPPEQKLSALPFVIKAVSVALFAHPSLNAHLVEPDDGSGNGYSNGKPALHLRAAHNIGVAVDTPSGLLVPVVRDVQSHSVLSLNAELARLAALARAGKLSSTDLAGATITVSNVGSIGGGVVSPVIVPPQVAIVGVGRARVVPGFDEETGAVVRKEEAALSWSADHRVLDGAAVARCAEEVRRLIEGGGEEMLVRMK
ncbi:2-oxoacid dehydrogenases acyltransferase-domain-containing protein [Lineolata rhizophorae]|uniref:Dihydrolipoamide acetyltransferase component of pyruvate dehydrogenase complex n=1 Tax=Lineolata rhizophorae TaxID=578093 RepID=A0A6A6PAR4_9PEZI|nr:2-oxoacid dehydrogenases acyltransferase-domain-containing protein [Lineolata rhizophorae]